MKNWQKWLAIAIAGWVVWQLLNPPGSMGNPIPLYVGDDAGGGA